MQVPVAREADVHVPGAAADGRFVGVPLLRPLAIRGFDEPAAAGDDAGR